MGFKKRRGVAEKQSKYSNVHYQKSASRGANSKHGFWKASIMRNGKQILNKLYEHEREAAKAVDWVLINLGEKPVNGFYTKA